MDLSLLKIPLKNRLEVVQLERHSFQQMEPEWIFYALILFIFSIVAAIFLV